MINALVSKELLSESDKEEFFSLKKWHFNISFGGSGVQVEPRDAVAFANFVNELSTKLTSL